MWIWVSTVFILTSRKTHIGRSARGPKITRAPCRRRIGRVVPHAENFGGLIAADRKVLSEGCESRNNHRFAVMVQDLAIPNGSSRIRAKQKLLRKRKELAKNLGAE